jgi:prevent-host-death family protein
METIPITEAKARIAELADRVAREHDHFTITRNGRADVMLISVAEYESMRETLDQGDVSLRLGFRTTAEELSVHAGGNPLPVTPHLRKHPQNRGGDRSRGVPLALRVGRQVVGTADAELHGSASGVPDVCRSRRAGPSGRPHPRDSWAKHLMKTAVAHS